METAGSADGLEDALVDGLAGGLVDKVANALSDAWGIADDLELVISLSVDMLVFVTTLPEKLAD